MKRIIPYFMVALLSASIAFTGVAAAAGVTQRISVSTTGSQGEGASHQPTLSADGQLIAFVSEAANLVAYDNNGQLDVFLRNRQTETTLRVSIASSGEEANGASLAPSISADGRYIAFSSNASNLVDGDTNGVDDVFVHDRLTATTFRVSINSLAEEANSSSSSPSISADGRYVAFVSYASNLIAEDTNGVRDVFVHDRQTGETKRVSVDSNGIQASNWSQNPSISADGRYVAFISYAANMVVGDTNGRHDVFVHDRQNGITSRVSVATTGEQGNNISLGPSISADGRYIAFYSYASNLVAGDTNGARDIFVHDRQTGTTTRVNISSTGTQSNAESYGPFISADGRYVTFASLADNLVTGDTNGHPDVFIFDREQGETQRVSVADSGEEGDSWSQGEIWQGQPVTSVVSANGNYVAFASAASNFVEGDSNQLADIFIFQRAANPPADVIPPVTTSSLSGTSGQNNWYLSEVEVQLAAADNPDGLGVSRTEYSLNGTDWINYTNPFTITEEGVTRLSYRSMDQAGNMETPKLETIMVDKTAPLITAQRPIDKGNYILNETVVSNWEAIDQISGIAAATGSVPTGATLDTASPGLKNLSITAVDQAGNQVTKLITYYVRYAFCGFMKPVDNSKDFNLGSVIPVKFQLQDAQKNIIKNAKAKLCLDKQGIEMLCRKMEANADCMGMTSNLFNYNSLEEQYTYELVTKEFSIGSWQLRICLDDGSQQAVTIALR